VTSLADYCEVKMGQAPEGSTYNTTGSGLPLIAGASDLGTVYPDAKRWTSSPTQVCQEGDIVLCIRATIGDRNWADREYCLGRGVAGLRAKRGLVEPRYLWHWLDTATPKLLQAGRGATFLQVNRKDIESLLFSPPGSLSEQRRIADILDKADAIRRKRRESIRLTEDLLRSAFLEMFGDPVTNPMGWPEAPLGQLADIASGVTKGKKYNGQPMVTLPYMRVANVHDGHLVLDDVKTITVSAADGQRYLLKTGDVLLTEGGDPDKLGRGAVWRDEIPGCIHQNHIFRVRPTGPVRAEYLSAIVGSDRGKRYFLRAAKQTTGIATINQTQLRAFPVLLPPLAAQDEYLAAIDRLDGLLANQRKGLEQVGELFGCLVHESFRGDLGATSASTKASSSRSSQ